MPTFLVTNDDGIDSPTLLPLAEALQPLGTVRIVVPEVERSWIGKAISRFGKVQVQSVTRAGYVLHGVAGTPADCVNLGLFELFTDPPDMVISGINLGVNYGTAFLLSSGTVGAALEAALAGVPAVACSLAIPRDVYGLAGSRRGALLGPRAKYAARVAADIVQTLLAHGFPPEVDAFSVNFPADVAYDTPRRVTPVARTRYGSVFARDGENGFVHRFKAYEAVVDHAHTDVETVRRGIVSIAPLRLQFDANLPQPWLRALEALPATLSGRAQS